MNYYLPNETGVPNSRSGHPVQPDPRTQGFSNGMYQPQQQQPGGGTNDFFNSVIDEIAQLRMPLDTKNSHSLPNIPYAQGRQSAPPTGLRQNTLMNFANSGSNLSTPIPQSQTSPVYDSFNNVQIRTPSFGNTQINPTMDLSPPGPIDALISLELQNFYNNNTNNYRKLSSHGKFRFREQHDSNCTTSRRCFFLTVFLNFHHAPRYSPLRQQHTLEQSLFNTKYKQQLPFIWWAAK